MLPRTWYFDYLLVAPRQIQAIQARSQTMSAFRSSCDPKRIEQTDRSSLLRSYATGSRKSPHTSNPEYLSSFLCRYGIGSTTTLFRHNNLSQYLGHRRTCSLFLQKEQS